ncbi:isoafricanol synthase [Streptomyces sp. NPDC021020]|uniref:isoafricanol synthase n=1 Tax=Streptomyces sp. NPDC021020 TaxID=3365109 RepID=UPI0037889FBC
MSPEPVAAPPGPVLPDPADPTRRTAAVRIPFPARLNPHAERARQHTLQWAQGMGLLTGDTSAAEYDALRLERLMAYFYPDAGAADLELSADFNAWFFIFDDQFDGLLGAQPERIRRLVADLSATMALEPHAPADGPEPDGPLVRSFRDIWRRSTDGTPRHWRIRFRDHWRAYLGAHEGEARHRNADRLPDLADFLTVRRETIGVRPCLDFTERCGGYSLPDDVHRAPALSEMREITCDVVIFVNDIVSLVKELAAGDVNNSVVVHRAHRGCTVEESVAHIAGLANARTARFVRLAADLPRALSGLRLDGADRAHVDHYVEGMRHLMAGNLTWSLATARYDEAGVAAVSGGRRRPWSLLVAPGPAESCGPSVR